MTFSIPEVDQLGWGQPLKDHLAQLNDPETGGLIHVLNVAERDSKFWPNGATDKDDFANKTVYVTATGTFHVWTISNDPANTRYWRELQKVQNIDWTQGVGTIESFGTEIRGNGTNFYLFNKNTQLKITTPSGQSAYINIKEVNSNVLTQTEGIATLPASNRFINPGLVSLTNNNTLTFINDVSTYNIEPGDTLYVTSDGYKYYAYFVVQSISGKIATVSQLTASDYVNPLFNASSLDSSVTIVDRIPPNSTYSFKKPFQDYTDEIDSKILLFPNGDIKGARFYTTPVENSSTKKRGYFSPGLSVITSVNKTSGNTTSLQLFVGDEANGWFTGIDNSAIVSTSAEDKEFKIVSFKSPITFYTDVLWSSSHAIRINPINGAGGSSTRLHVNGNLVATGTITPGSDRRWKEDIVKIDSALSKISLLEGITYYWKDKEVRGAERHIGLIAQDVEKAFPEAVIKDEEGYMSVNYNGLVGALVESIKELKVTIDSLTQRIVMLESK